MALSVCIVDSIHGITILTRQSVIWSYCFMHIFIEVSSLEIQKSSFSFTQDRNFDVNSAKHIQIFISTLCVLPDISTSPFFPSQPSGWGCWLMSYCVSLLLIQWTLVICLPPVFCHLLPVTCLAACLRLSLSSSFVLQKYHLPSSCLSWLH